MVHMKIRPVGILPWKRHKVKLGVTELLQALPVAVAATHRAHTRRDSLSCIFR